ncbi:galactofuranosyltransferase [Bacteroides sp. 224]|uniref:galactofuranosyltransferase n=1 Tax=Bacteroides sp. 224 TaxID=2302936 RepID=UPI0013D28241|nr:galactofuranosyltransferase [Bacteroides sp. 224]NDV64294.1 galactofuranosyltransferase [Bacteroides sp. 224]
MRRVYISRNYKGVNSAGNKAKIDIETAIQAVGFENVGLKPTLYSNKIIDFAKNFIGVLKVVFCMPQGGILLLQYPMKKYFSFVSSLAHLKDVKVVTLIHDLGTFRRKKLTIEKEIERLNHSDYIIAQNPKMRVWLQQHGYKGQIGVLEIFDYLSPGCNQTGNKPEASSEPYVINYIGALSKRKNAFLYEMSPFINKYDFHLYGGGFVPGEQEAKNPHFVYKGFCAGNDLISSLLGDFGLVWDGDSLDTCSGNFGVYLKHNSPHKISLYIRCHLPVIIWKEAAMASFIVKEDIGFVIESLTELDEILAGMTTERYNEMKQNVTKISQRLSEGYYVKKAVAQAESELLNLHA